MGLIDPIVWKWLIPEIALLPSKRARIRVWGVALNYGFTIKYWCPCFFVICLATVFIGMRFNLVWLNHPLSFLATAWIGHIMIVAFWSRKIRATVRECLREINRCVHCGYDLRSCTSEKCPECGTVWERPIKLVSLEQAMLRD